MLPSNQLDTPHDPLKTGWYYIYDKPGFRGTAVFSAHVDYYPNIIGPFNKLKNSEIGDDIVVVMENGLEYKYRVIRKERYDVATIPMGDLIWPTNKPADTEWVTLITCGGEFRSATPGGPGEYLHRDVVVAERSAILVSRARTRGLPGAYRGSDAVRIGLPPIKGAQERQYHLP
ncbi:class F sortase [bacterium]|nr:MAG: class F sortase [bacterium]